MDGKAIDEDIKKAMRDIKKEDIIAATKQHEDAGKKNPFTVILVLALALLIIVMVVPYESIRSDPEPANIPSKESVMPADIESLRNVSSSLSVEARGNYARLTLSGSQEMRNMAAKISTASCPENELCYAKALFYFVRDQLQYVPDPKHGYLDNPFETLYQGGADCDGLSILLASMLGSIGIPARFAFVPDHVFVQVKLDNAPRKYKEKDGWISIDPACSYCEVGELSFSTRNQQMEFLYV